MFNHNLIRTADLLTPGGAAASLDWLPKHCCGKEGQMLAQSGSNPLCKTGDLNVTAVGHSAHMQDGRVLMLIFSLCICMAWQWRHVECCTTHTVYGVVTACTAGCYMHIIIKDCVNRTYAR